MDERTARESPEGAMGDMDEGGIRGFGCVVALDRGRWSNAEAMMDPLHQKI
jgi:hypothetical protein